VDNMNTQAALSFPQKRSAAKFRTILGGALGHFIEWYEFALYGFLGSVLAGHIFPPTDPTAALIASFSVYAIGFLGRPIGAFVLSPLCDKIGRKKLLSLTILLAGLGSLAIALCPDYATIGILAPIIVTLARLLQGFSAGGEFQIAITFLNEHARPKYRAFSASPQTVCIGLGILAACGVAGLVTHFLSAHALNTWGWRLPFLLGAFMSLYGVIARRGLGETPAFEEISRGRRASAMTILRSLRSFKREALLVFILEMNVVQYTLFLVFLPSYAHLTTGLPVPVGFSASVIATIVYCVVSPPLSLLSDHVGRKPLFIAGAVLFLLFTYPLLHALTTSPSFSTYLFVAIVGSLFVATTGAPFSTTMAELFPTAVRATGIGIPYAISIAMFGGTSPIVIVWLQNRGGVVWVSAYVMTISLISLVVYLTLLPETGGRSLTSDADFT
jgi:MHS family alpha-ketoglutarate permease-like MFS transporter